VIVLASTLTGVLLAISALHVYWGAGGFWPGKDAGTCARTVVGVQGIDEMPGVVPSFAVAVALLMLAWIALAQAGAIGWPFSAWLLRVATIGAAAVFLLRGVAGYLPVWRRHFREQPFAMLNSRYYSPLCLVLGTGFLVLGFGVSP
jgi:hypothetical protein